MTIDNMSRYFVRLSIVVWLFVPNSVLANDTFVYDNGHAAYPINTDKIRMVSEKISVNMEGTGTNRIAHVTCEFFFKNTTSQEVKAKIGFPSYYEIGDNEQQKPPLWDFVSFIDGKKVKVAIRKQAKKKGLKGIYWYTWDVAFPPSQRVTLKNTYKAPLSFSYSNQWFTYILKTGANWKGPIGQSEIEIIYKSNEDLRRRVVKASPSNFRIDDNKIIWKFINFTPTEDINLYERNVSSDYYFADPIFWDKIIKIFNAKKYEGNSRYYSKSDLSIGSNKHLLDLASALKENYVGNVSSEQQFLNEISRQYLRILRNEIFARHGRGFVSKDLNGFFAHRMKWYKDDSNYSDSELNAYEKKNIAKFHEN